MPTHGYSYGSNTKGGQPERTEALVDAELGHALILDKVHIVNALLTLHFILSVVSVASFE
jgi:hypothetical protein